MRWFTDVSVWGEKPDVVQVFNSNNECFDYVPERTCRNLDKHYNIMFKCSECGHWECQDFEGEKMLPQTWNYCPSCGARVIGVEVE